MFALPLPPGLIKLLNGQIIVTATNSLLAKTAAISQLCWSLTSGQFWGRILKSETAAMFFSSFQTAILLQQAKWKGCHFVSEVVVSSGPRLQVVRLGTFGTLVCTNRADKSVELQTRCRHDHPNPRIRLSVCVCVCHQKTPSNTLSTAAPKMDSG